ncbi:protein BIG GRAIN 1-like A [Salvia hispanica]|uniref:protein BIG GRAIN 1-like A n=1 Tax=Salvia hispanica TaxID=49212 RepID=UPI002009514A|nr:protein BIG GRAIN 1-like A [Salvia hispanica]
MVERCGYGRESEISHFASSNSSFSSSLLDAIYRSIDRGDEEVPIYGGGVRKKSFGAGGAGGANVRRGVIERDEEMESFQRACMVEKWVEKKVSEKSVGRRRSVADFDQVKKLRKDRESSSWSSSDSSSEAESIQVQRPKPIRTGIEKEKIATNRRESEQKPKIEGGFSKTKLRALKIYGDLKKVKQPISPGGKLAGFLNSLFPGGKGKIGDESPILKSTTSASSCSSRSCLSKTPSSRGNAKRSVRFSPVSVIVDSEINNKKQTSSNHSSKNSIRSVINEELMAHVMDQNRRVEEVARDLLRNYQRQNQQPQVFNRNFDDDEDDNDAASCASSDLFELDNLSAIGMEIYREELPVYETTRLDSAGNGLIY